MRVRHRHPSAALACGAMLWACGAMLWACGPAPRGEEPPAHAAVVRAARARLEAAIAADDAARPASAALGREELREELHGLLVLASGADSGLREAALEDARRLGAQAVPELQAALGSAAAPAGQRTAAALLLAAVEAPAASEALLEAVEHAGEPWLRAQCAWRLGDAGQRDDWVVPRLVLRLRYETDLETVVWISDSLARLGNYQGLYGLRSVVEAGAGPALAATARERAAAHAAALGFADPLELERAWDSGDGELALPRRAHSPRYDLECWRLVESFEGFALRPVDDARFVLARLDWAIAGVLAAALADESRYVRHGAAQALARLGPRGSAAGPELARALGDPSIATEAASALGRIGWPPGEAELLARLDSACAFELRLAAARAIGGLGQTTSVPALSALFAADEPLELRQAAAESLVTCGSPGEALPLLVELLTSPAVEPATSEAALRYELARRAREPSPGGERARAALAEWDALAPRADVVETPQAISARRADRQRIARAALLDA